MPDPRPAPPDRPAPEPRAGAGPPPAPGAREAGWSRRAVLGLMAGGAVTAVGGAAYGTAEADRLDVVRTARRVRGLERPLRVVQMTDFHVGPFVPDDRIRRWTRAAMAERADLIVVTGDVVDRTRPDVEMRVAGHLASLRAPLGVWACWGNHDHEAFQGGLEPLRVALEGAGVRPLRNAGTRLRADLLLGAVDDFRKGRPRPDRALEGAEDPEGRGARILLSHNPDQVPELGPGSWDVVLSGHTHGGQIVPPLIGPIVTSSRYGRRFVGGWTEAPVPAYVSRGLGVSGVIPLRVNCLPELTVLELRPA